MPVSRTEWSVAERWLEEQCYAWVRHPIEAIVEAAYGIFYFVRRLYAWDFVGFGFQAEAANWPVSVCITFISTTTSA